MTAAKKLGLFVYKDDEKLANAWETGFAYAMSLLDSHSTGRYLYSYPDKMTKADYEFCQHLAHNWVKEEE